MLFKRFMVAEYGGPEPSTAAYDEQVFLAGYNAALDMIAERCEDGINITPEWAHWMKGEIY